MLRINKVQEAGGPTQGLYGFLIQTPLPKVQGNGDWITVDVT